MCEAVIAALPTAPEPDSPAQPAPGLGRVAARAVALRAVLAEAPETLSPAERHLLAEWLDRLSAAPLSRENHGLGSLSGSLSLQRPCGVRNPLSHRDKPETFSSKKVLWCLRGSGNASVSLTEEVV